MLTNPRPGQEVQIWYRAEMRELMRFHGCGGYVAASAPARRPGRKSGPRNHLVQVGLLFLIVPAGNLRKVGE